MSNQNDSHTTEFERITPAKVEITRDQSAPKPEAAHSQQNRQSARSWVLPALAGLAVLLLAVFFLLPRLVPQPEVVLETGRSETGQNVSGTARQAPEASPWQEAQSAKQRKAAQDVLETLLEKQFQLEELKVQLWADEAFSQAKEIALRGDDAYRQRQFNQAVNEYRKADELLGGLILRAEEVKQEQLTLGLQALLDGNAQRATEAFQLLLEIDPLNNKANEGLARAGKLDRVLALLQQAEAEEAKGELDQAEVLVKEALSIDEQTPKAQQVSARLTGKITERDFTAAMSAGYTALANNQYELAKKHFTRASRLKPKATEARDGFDQANHRIARDKIAVLRKKAEVLENEERWRDAQSRYARVLQLDESVIFAQQGYKKTETRAKLDELLQSKLDAPQRLGNQKVYEEALQLIEVARTVAAPGPRLQSQVEQLEAALRLAKEPVTVQLRSDNQTEVTLYRVGRLGNFIRHELSLVPGSYTLIGKRSGYRDVRKEFVVSTKSEVAPITIQCVEKI